MDYIEILRRPDKSRVRIQVSAYADYSDRSLEWSVSVATCAKGKRTWVTHPDYNSWGYRDAKDRDDYKKKAQLKVVTKEEILSAKLKLWEKAKPS